MFHLGNGYFYYTAELGVYMYYLHLNLFKI